MRKLVVLGSTGSIGRQTLDVVAHLPDWQITGLAAGTNTQLLLKQAREHSVRTVAVADMAKAEELAVQHPELDVLVGQSGVEQLAQAVDCDMVAVAVVGASGIGPTVAAIAAGKDVALSNKETLVAAGPLVMAQAQKHGVRIFPVDSEHSAIFQCLRGERQEELNKIYLTASGGPFRNMSWDEMKSVTPQMALKHPTWQMGGKITIDSATMMNKGLEVIEAVRLFGVSPEEIQVVVHPQSIVHSMVEFCDGSIIAHLGPTDMRIPIQYALTYPTRVPSPASPLDVFSSGSLEFISPDLERFPCLELAYQAIAAGESVPAVLNAANEVAVQAFLAGAIGFTDIARVVESVIEAHTPMPLASIEDVLTIDQWARCRGEDIVKGWCQ